MNPREEELVEEWHKAYPNQKLYGVPNKVFMHFHQRFPYRHLCWLFYGTAGMEGQGDYISIIPLLDETEEKTIPEDKGIESREFIFANDL